MRIACGLIMPMELCCIIEVIKSEFAQFMADECSLVGAKCVFIIIPSLTFGSASSKIVRVESRSSKSRKVSRSRVSRESHAAESETLQSTHKTLLKQIPLIKSHAPAAVAKKMPFVHSHQARRKLLRCAKFLHMTSKQVTRNCWQVCSLIEKHFQLFTHD